MPGYYQLVEASDGNTCFQLRAGNHEVIFISRIFRSRQAALEGVAWMRLHGAERFRFHRHTSSEGSPYFKLVDDDGQEVGRSALYASRSGVDAGIASVCRNCTVTIFRGLIRRTSLVD